MGWNEGYRIMEQQVISLYEAKVLNKDVLKAVMEPFRDSDIDSGGSQELRTEDGKSAENVVVFIMEPEKYQEAVENYVPTDPDDDFNEDLDRLWNTITKKEWGFW